MNSMKKGSYIGIWNLRTFWLRMKIWWRFVILAFAGRSIRNCKWIVFDVALHTRCLLKYIFTPKIKRKIQLIQRKQIFLVLLWSCINCCTLFIPSIMKRTSSSLWKEFSKTKQRECLRNLFKSMGWMFTGLKKLFKED